MHNYKKLFPFVALLSWSVFGSSGAKSAAGPQRIVSTGIASDEIILELLDKSEISRLIAVSNLADDPKYSNVAGSVKNIPHRYGRQAETVASWRPDLIIASAFNDPAPLRVLSELKIPIQTLPAFTSLQAIQNAIRSIGAWIERTKQAETMAATFEKQRNQLCKASQSETAVIYSADFSNPGHDTLVNEVLGCAGLVTVVAKRNLSGWKQISAEVLLKENPSWIVVTTKDDISKIKTDPVWSQLSATKKNRFLLVPGARLYSASQHSLTAIASLQKAQATWAAE